MYSHLISIKSEMKMTKMTFQIKNLFELASTVKQIQKEAEENKPYTMNIIDAIGTDENANSSILASFFRQHGEDGEYKVLKHFINYVFGASLSQRITNPVIHTEEVVSDNKRIDILVYEKDQYAIIMENKIWEAPEQNHQLANYIEGMNAKGFSNDQIYIIYLPRTGEGGPSNISWINTAKHSYKEEFCERYSKISFKEGILAWLEQEDFPEVETPYFESSKQIYIDYLKGIFHLRNNGNMEQDQIKQYLEEALNLNGDCIHDASVLAQKADELSKCIDLLKQFRTENLKDCFRKWHKQLAEDYPEFQDQILYQESQTMYCVGISVPYMGKENAINLVIEFSNQWLGYGLKYGEIGYLNKVEMQEWARSKQLNKGMVKGSNYLYYATKPCNECYNYLKGLIDDWRKVQ